MRPVRVDPRALADLARAKAWYDDQCAGLGTRFVVEVENALVRAAGLPFAYSPFRRHTRRVLVSRFPYAVYYVPEGDVVRVLAVLHQRRGESAWKGRVQEGVVVAVA